MDEHQPVRVALADVARATGVVGAFAAISALILTWFPADITRTSAIHEDLVTTESRIAGSVVVFMWPLGLAAGILAAVLGLVALGRSIEVLPGEADAHRLVPVQIVEVKRALGLADEVEPLHAVLVEDDRPVG